MALVLITSLVQSNWKDQHPNYSVDLQIKAPAITNDIKVGFAKMPITPEVIDTWNDVNNDAKCNEDDGNSRIALVTIDAIGFMHDDVIDGIENIPNSILIAIT